MAIKNQEIRLINFFKNRNDSCVSYGQTDTGATFAYFQNKGGSIAKYFDGTEERRDWAELVILASSRKVIKSILYHKLGKFINNEDIYEAPSGGVFQFTLYITDYAGDSEACKQYRHRQMAEIMGLKFKPARPEFLLYAELAD